MKTYLPLVSICIPTFNGGEFITAAMDSAITQTYNNLEIIVSDDASKDDTLEIINSYKDITDIPIYIYNHKPNGIGANWNNSLKKAKGEYIKFLFQDDLLEPSCISEMVEVLENDLNTCLVSSKRNFIVETDVNSREAEIWISQFSDLQSGLNLKLENGIYKMNRTIFKHPLFFNNPLNKIGEPSAYMFRKYVLQEVGDFRTDLKQILDMEFCYRLLKNYNISVINKELVSFRLHSSQASKVNEGDSNDLILLRKILFSDFFCYVSWSQRWSLLKQQSLFLKLLIKLKQKIK